MRSLLYPILLLVYLCSCGSESINQDCQAKANQLQQRVDSLEVEINNLKSKLVITTPVRTKKSKKKKIEQTAEQYGVPVVSLDPPKSQRAKQVDPYVGQCMAITKKGTRCSRSARSGGYCWQHGG